MITLPKGRWFSYAVDVRDGKVALDLRIVGPAQPPFVVPAPFPLPGWLNGCGITVACGDENGNTKPDVTVEFRVKGKALGQPLTWDIPVTQALDGFEFAAGFIPDPPGFVLKVFARGLRSVIPGAST